MEFIAITRVRDNVSPEHRHELLRVFGQWQPPQGFNLKFLYFSAEGNRSVGLVEVNDASVLADVAARFAQFVDFEWIPVLPAQQAAAIMGEALAWAEQARRG
jgi:hypothetical protein